MADNYIERQYEQYEARKAAWEKSRKTVRKKPAVQQPEHRAVLQNQVKKIVAVHDLSGVGRVSLTAVIPILSTMGFQVCPLPTAVLSTHTQYPEFSFLDLTEEMKKIIEKWEKLHIKFDTFYTGYLGSAQQAQIVQSFIQRFRRPTDLVVTDPVLGDNGHLYTGITEEMVREMRQLIQQGTVCLFVSVFNRITSQQPQPANLTGLISKVFHALNLAAINNPASRPLRILRHNIIFHMQIRHFAPPSAASCVQPPVVITGMQDSSMLQAYGLNKSAHKLFFSFPHTHSSHHSERLCLPHF